MTISKEVQKLEMDAVVSLYILDTTPIGGTDVFYFTPMPKEDGSSLSFGNRQYTAIDMDVTGFRWDGQGQFPTPKVLLANFEGFMTALIVNFGDIVGSKFTRIRTFRKHLDDGDDPDPDAMFPIEIFTVNQRTEHNAIYVEYELKSVIDQQGVNIPNRQCIRETCTHTYRIFDPSTGSFDYSNASCPYTKAAAYDKDGNTVPQAQDDCGRRLDDCKLRFGEKRQLPTRAFPGISRNR